MIEEVIVYQCEKCKSVNIVRNGHTLGGRQKYKCKDCGHHGRLDKAPRYNESEKETIIKTYFERSSLRGLQRIFGVCRETVMRWLKERVSKLKSLKEIVSEAKDGDVVELDELWSFVKSKKQKRWVWIAICRRTREIIAFAIGDRSEKTGRKLWQNIPDSYKSAKFYSDFWDAYAKIFPEKLHQAVGKDSGQTNHVERWNNTLRQRVGRFVRKSLSFSKLDQHHFIHLRVFIDLYNSTLSPEM